MKSHARLSRLSTEDYLQGELHSPVRHEFVSGRTFAMVGASESHNIIAGNIYTALRAHLRGGPCRAFISDMKVQVEKADSFYYPDVMVTCDPTDSENYYKTKPSLIIEVLSPATEAIDRREKLLAFQQLPSLREYVLVSTDRVQVEVFRRDEQGEWWQDTYGPDDAVPLQSVDLILGMDMVYENSRPG